MGIHCEAFHTEVLRGEGAALPPTLGAGIARLIEQALARAGADGEATIGGHLWISDRWQAEIVVAGQRKAEEASFELGHHLLFRLADFAVRTLGGELPEAAIRAFDDLATTAPGALIAYLAGLGAEGGERRRHWQRAFELDPHLITARTGLAAMLLENGGEAAAAASLVRGLAVHDGAVAAELGLALWAVGEADTAAELLPLAVKANPQDAIPMAALAALLARRSASGAEAPEALDEALLLAAQATQLAADDFRCWAALADVHRAGGNFDQAGFYYGFALKLAPEAPTVLKDAAACWLLARQPAQALPLIERALRAAPADADHLGNLAFAHHQLGDGAAALEAARRAAAQRPGDARLRILHGDLALRAGRREEAFAAWARAAELNPGMTINPEGGNLA